MELENVAVVNELTSCNLRPPDATPVLFCINYDAMPILKSLNLSIAVLLLPIHYFTL